MIDDWTFTSNKQRASNMKLFFDTETTGKVQLKLEPTHHSQPSIVQLSALLLNNEWETCAELNVIIEPTGWSIPQEVTSIHGINAEYATLVGVPLHLAMAMFSALLSKADLAIGHNVDFDKFVINTNNRRVGILPVWPETFCTMRKMADVCKIPSPISSYGYKWPKLAEAYQFCFEKPLENAHDAMSDVRACAAIYKWMSDNKNL